MNLRKLLNTPALALVIGIPILSVVVGATMFYLAISSADPDGSVIITSEQAPLSKTSWRGEQP